MSRPTIGSAARSEVVTFRCTKAEKDRIEAAAAAAGVSPGRFAYIATIKRTLTVEFAESLDVPMGMIEGVTQRHTEGEN